MKLWHALFLALLCPPLARAAEEGIVVTHNAGVGIVVQATPELVKIFSCSADSRMMPRRYSLTSASGCRVLAVIPNHAEALQKFDRLHASAFARHLKSSAEDEARWNAVKWSLGTGALTGFGRAFFASLAIQALSGGAADRAVYARSGVKSVVYGAVAGLLTYAFVRPSADAGAVAQDAARSLEHVPSVENIARDRMQAIVPPNAPDDVARRAFEAYFSAIQTAAEAFGA